MKSRQGELIILLGCVINKKEIKMRLKNDLKKIIIKEKSEGLMLIARRGDFARVV